MHARDQRRPGNSRHGHRAQPLALPRPRLSTRCPSPGRRAPALRLVVGTVTVVLGLAAVIAGLAPSAMSTSTAPSERPRLSASATAAPVRPPRAGLAQAPPPERGLVDQPDAAARSHGSATDPWRSPLAPQHGLTLWQRIQVSTSTDFQVFLVGSAIQLYAPQTAATPEPQYNRFP
jgi:hypothetical protein